MQAGLDGYAEATALSIQIALPVRESFCLFQKINQLIVKV